MNRRQFALGVSGTTVSGLAGCLSAVSPFGDEKREERRTYAVEDGTELRVRNENGPVSVEHIDGEEVELEAAVSGPTAAAREAVSVADRRTEGALHFETEYGSEAEGANASLTIRYPEAAYPGLVRTSNAGIDIDVARLEGDATLVTSNGSVDAAIAPDLDAVVTATTSNGSVTTEGLELADAERSETELYGVLGDGTVSLSSETENAGIALEKLSS